MSTEDQKKETILQTLADEFRASHLVEPEPTPEEIAKSLVTKLLTKLTTDGITKEQQKDIRLGKTTLIDTAGGLDDLLTKEEKAAFAKFFHHEELSAEENKVRQQNLVKFLTAVEDEMTKQHAPEGLTLDLRKLTVKETLSYSTAQDRLRADHAYLSRNVPGLQADIIGYGHGAHDQDKANTIGFGHGHHDQEAHAADSQTTWLPDTKKLIFNTYKGKFAQYGITTEKQFSAEIDKVLGEPHEPARFNQFYVDASITLHEHQIKEAGKMVDRIVTPENMPKFEKLFSGRTSLCTGNPLTFTDDMSMEEKIAEIKNTLYMGNYLKGPYYTFMEKLSNLDYVLKKFDNPEIDAPGSAEKFIVEKYKVSEKRANAILYKTTLHEHKGEDHDQVAGNVDLMSLRRWVQDEFSFIPEKGKDPIGQANITRETPVPNEPVHKLMSTEHRLFKPRNILISGETYTSTFGMSKHTYGGAEIHLVDDKGKPILDRELKWDDNPFFTIATQGFRMSANLGPNRKFSPEVGIFYETGGTTNKQNGNGGYSYNAGGIDASITAKFGNLTATTGQRISAYSTILDQSLQFTSFTQAGYKVGPTTTVYSGFEYNSYSRIHAQNILPQTNNYKITTRVEHTTPIKNLPVTFYAETGFQKFLPNNMPEYQPLYPENVDKIALTAEIGAKFPLFKIKTGNKFDGILQHGTYKMESAPYVNPVEQNKVILSEEHQKLLPEDHGKKPTETADKKMDNAVKEAVATGSLSWSTFKSAKDIKAEEKARKKAEREDRREKKKDDGTSELHGVHENGHDGEKRDSEDTNKDNNKNTNRKNKKKGAVRE